MLRRLRIKLFNWEYWPTSFVYFPIHVYYYTLLSLKARTIFFLPAVNPSMKLGGLLGVSKFDILNLLPDSVKPITILIKPKIPFEEVLSDLKNANLNCPIICKPDIGERGFRVQKINNETELKKYHSESNIDYLIQEYIDLPLELGVFCIKKPNQSNFIISSVVQKKFLTVIGDGKRSIQELCLEDDRSFLVIDHLKATYPALLQEIPKLEEEIELEPIGNHCRGTTFLSGMNLIDLELVQIFNVISKQINGFHYGRFDLRAESIEEVKKGNFKVMELNGVNSEPAHIYSPNFSLLEGYKTLFWHWTLVGNISRANHKNGARYTNYHEVIGVLNNYNRNMKNLSV